MPLTRTNVTVAQRVMIPVNVLFALVIGYACTFESDRLTNAPAYAGADELLPLQVWGIGFLGIAAWLTAATVWHRRVVYVVGLACLFAWMGAWTILFAIVWARGDATFIAWAFPAYVAAACWASMLSLLAHEGSR